MKSGHVTFEQLSDLMDDALASSKERDAIMKHLAQCPECATEFKSLSRTVSLCRQIALCHMKGEDLCTCIQDRMRSRNRRRALSRSLPAIAASFLIVSGAAFYTMLIPGGADRSTVATVDEERPRIAAPIVIRPALNSAMLAGFAGTTVVPSVRRHTDAEKVLAVFRKHQASISSVSDLYVEGRVSLAGFASLRRDLGDRRVAYAIVGSPRRSLRGSEMSGAIAPVGMGNAIGFSYQRHLPEDADSDQYVVFRVFR